MMNHADFWTRLAPAILEAVALAGCVIIYSEVTIRFDCMQGGREWWIVTAERSQFGCAPETPPAAVAA